MIRNILLACTVVLYACGNGDSSSTTGSSSTTPSSAPSTKLPTEPGPVSSAGPDAGAGAEDAGSHEEPLVVISLSKKDLCPLGNEEDSHPQGRLRKGGCLESFQHVIAENGATPPAALPSVVYGYARGSSDRVKRYVRIELKAVAGDICVKDSKGKNIVSDIPLYEAIATTEEGAKINLCDGQEHEQSIKDGAKCTADEARRLDGKAVAIPGYWKWSERGDFLDRDGGRSAFTLACASGAAAKCVHWGYVPWVTYGETQLRDHYLACVRAVRAEYRSDNEQSYTCKGAIIDVYDNLGIQTKDTTATGVSFEAVWGKNGVVYMDRPRFEACAERDDKGNKVRELLPRFTDAHPKGGADTALIGVRSPKYSVKSNNCPTSNGLCQGITKE